MASYTRQPIYKTQSKGKSGGSVVHGKTSKKSKSRSAAKQKMPLCSYGSACRRPNCIYRHDKKSKKTTSDMVCPHYLAGICEYGKHCEHRHPSDEECYEYRMRFAGQICRNGDACITFGCLYAHPARDMAEQMHQQLALEATTLSIGAQEWTPPWENDASVLPATTTTSVRVSVSASSIQQQDPTLIPQRWAKADGSLPVGTSTSSAGQGPKKKLYMQIPIDVWTPNYSRNPSHFQIVDPLERFREVNKHHALNPHRTNVIDVHYQTALSVLRVLDLLLPQYEQEDVWIVTGTGHHKGGHQKSGVLFDTVERYLVSRNYLHLIGKSGETTGAFFIPGVQ